MVEALYHAARRRSRLERLAGTGAHSAPAVRTDSPHRAGSALEALCRGAELVGRCCGGKPQVAEGLVKDVQSLGVWTVDSCS